jgi:hypothetical protein
MSYCKNCGEKLEDGSIYCPRCGAKQPKDIMSASPSMKWHDFLTNFYLYFISGLYVYNAISLFIALGNGGTELNEIYNYQLLQKNASSIIALGIFLLMIAAWTVMAAVNLKKMKLGSDKIYLINCGFRQLFGVVVAYVLAKSMSSLAIYMLIQSGQFALGDIISSMDQIMTTFVVIITVVGIINCLVTLIPSIIYYRKRASLFKPKPVLGEIN